MALYCNCLGHRTWGPIRVGIVLRILALSLGPSVTRQLSITFVSLRRISGRCTGNGGRNASRRIMRASYCAPKYTPMGLKNEKIYT
jgi:hypothetical protein